MQRSPSERRALPRRSALWLGAPLVLLVACAQILGIKSGRLHGACTTEAQCAPGYACQLGECRLPCQEDAVCESGQRCLLTDDFDVCVATSIPCGEGCPGGTLCVAGTCRTECGGTLECGGGQDCVGRTCIGANESTGGAGASGAPSTLGGGGSSSSQSGAGGAAEPGACGPETYDHDGLPATPCVDWEVCEPGQRISVPGSAAQNRECVACSPGSFTAVQNMDTCAMWRNCELGSHLSQAGTPMADRQCMPCEAGETTTILNQEMCLGDGECAPGTLQLVAAMGSTPAQCEACEIGTFCPGGAAPKTNCENGFWDKDGAATACEAWTPCNPGTRAVDGTATIDRTCPPCTSSTFSEEFNAESCTLWGDCTGWLNGGLIKVGTTMANAVCGVQGSFRQIGSSMNTIAYGVAVTLGGEVYVGGSTTHALQAGASNAGGRDAFVVKYDDEGQVDWVRQFGTATDDFLEALAIDTIGNVYVTGRTSGVIAGTQSGEADVFVRKYRPNGDVDWTDQFGTLGADEAYGIVVVDRAEFSERVPGVFIVGATKGSLDPAWPNTNMTYDAFIRMYSTTGVAQWTRQFGTNVYDAARAVASDDEGSLYLAGHTQQNVSGALDGDDVFVRKYTQGGELVWDQPVGSADQAESRDIAVDAARNVFVTGFSDGGLTGTATLGSTDGFLARLDPDGVVDWTIQVGSSSYDTIEGVALDGSGRIYVVGTTAGALQAGAAKGGRDGFISRVAAADGSVEWTQQYGSAVDDYGYGVAVGPGDFVFAVGSTQGNLTAEGIVVDTASYVGRFSIEPP